MNGKLLITLIVIHIAVMLAGCNLKTNYNLDESNDPSEPIKPPESYIDLFEKDMEFKDGCEVIYTEEMEGVEISILAATVNNSARMQYEMGGNGFDIYITPQKAYMNTIKGYENNWIFAIIHDKKRADDLKNILDEPMILDAEYVEYLGYVGEEFDNNIIYDIVEISYEDFAEAGNYDKYKGYCYINRNTKEISEIELNNLDKNIDIRVRTIKSIDIPQEAITAKEVEYDTIRTYMLNVMPDGLMDIDTSHEKNEEVDERLSSYKDFFNNDNIFFENRHIYIEGKSYKVPYKLEFADCDNKHMEKYYFGDTFIEFYVIGDMTYLHVKNGHSKNNWYYLNDINGESTTAIRQYLFETLVFSTEYIYKIYYNEQLSTEGYDVLELDLLIGENGSSALVWVNKEKRKIEKISTDYGYEEQRILIDEKVSIELPAEAINADEVGVEMMLEKYMESIENGVSDLINNARIVE